MQYALPKLPQRDPGGHKGTFGAVAVFGGCCAGSVRMIGAPALTALGALRSGCGLARIFAPEPIMHEVLTIAPSATGRSVQTRTSGGLSVRDATAAVGEACDACDALVMGPGMGISPGGRAALLAVLARRDVGRVLDADALNMLAVDAGNVDALDMHGGGTAVLTPHPGEFKRLREAFKLPAGEDDQRSAQTLAARLSCVVVLKGHRTLITDGRRTHTNDTGNAALATGGTGDVLAGVIAGLIAQHGPRAGRSERATRDIFTLAALGVRAHGLAADLWRERRHASGGLLSTELLDLIPEAVERLREPVKP